MCVCGDGSFRIWVLSTEGCAGKAWALEHLRAIALGGVGYISLPSSRLAVYETPSRRLVDTLDVVAAGRDVAATSPAIKQQCR